MGLFYGAWRRERESEGGLSQPVWSILPRGAGLGVKVHRELGLLSLVHLRLF